ncbi:MAG: hypothetical protein WCR48_01690 [Bacteroidales bacterium]
MQKKIDYIHSNSLTAHVSPSEETEMDEVFCKDTLLSDTLEIRDAETDELIIMKAVKDENGEMVATDVINAAKITARFRNVAERHGKVDLSFQVIVPHTMLDSRWQLRLIPQLYVLEDSALLDPVIVTGCDYRKAQLKGYEQYRRFISSIITDPTQLIDIHQLEVFIKRNIPALYRFKTDSSFVSDERFESAYGVTEKQAMSHYTNELALWRNERRKSRKKTMYAKFVKAPLVSEGIRLDTVIFNTGGDVVYEYVQTLNTRPKLKKATIVLSGAIYEMADKIYTIPPSEPLVFYISSVSSLIDDKRRYLDKVIERRAMANTVCYIDFDLSSSIIDERMGENSNEIRRIKENVLSLCENRHFDIDSILVTASCSPEGTIAYNKRLAQRRSESVSDYFSTYLRHVRDSLDREHGFSLDEEGKKVKKQEDGIRFLSRSNPENWAMLDAMVHSDSILTESQKKDYSGVTAGVKTDAKERSLHDKPYYQRLRTVLYPRLRTVRFDFYLHRKGMIKDTVHTTVLDSVYMIGLEAIRDRDYKKAVSILRPYNDLNSAVAFCAMDYNASAMAILNSLEKTAKVNYMMAIIYGRNGDERNAVQSFLRSCKQNPSFVHRGNLDPEISILIKKYGLNKNH